jgi:LCP family protein required for cell wall assembly
MSKFQQLSCLFLAVLLAGCSAPGLIPAPIFAAALPASTQPANDYQVPADATATPTPFQPLPPTPVYIPTDLPTATPLPTATATPTAKPTDKNQPPEDQINILLLGSDQRPWDRFFRTDTIILASINPSLGTVNLLSFPRDLYINIPGWGQDRINTAWVHGGYKKLAATLKANFGIRVDHYVLINFTSFKRLIDGLGGLDIDVGQPVSDYYRGRYINIPVGPKHMNADMVLWYVRTRKTTNDFARNRRQQEVLTAVAYKLLSMDAIAKAPELYAIYSASVTTDLSLTDLLPLLPMAAQLSDSSRLHHYYISPKQVYDWITPGGAMVLLPRQDAVMKVVRQAMSGR